MTRRLPRLMRALAAGGRRAEALHHYRKLVRFRASELAVAPDPETEQLFDQLRASMPPAGAHPVITAPVRRHRDPLADPQLPGQWDQLAGDLKTVVRAQGNIPRRMVTEIV